MAAVQFLHHAARTAGAQLDGQRWDPGARALVVETCPADANGDLTLGGVRARTMPSRRPVLALAAGEEEVVYTHPLTRAML
eukprot:8603308-Lingulodinium_polyedra.AAC.1